MQNFIYFRDFNGNIQETWLYEKKYGPKIDSKLSEEKRELLRKEEIFFAVRVRLSQLDEIAGYSSKFHARNWAIKKFGFYNNFSLGTNSDTNNAETVIRNVLKHRENFKKATKQCKDLTKKIYFANAPFIPFESMLYDWVENGKIYIMNGEQIRKIKAKAARNNKAIEIIKVAMKQLRYPLEDFFACPIKIQGEK